MRRRISDVVAVAAILSGAAGAFALRGVARSDGTPGVADPYRPTAIRVTEVGPGGAGVMSRLGRTDVAVDVGTEIPVPASGFEASFHVPHHWGRVPVRVEFLRDGAVVGSASITALRPRVFVDPGRFGVRGI